MQDKKSIEEQQQEQYNKELYNHEQMKLQKIGPYHIFAYCAYCAKNFVKPSMYNIKYKAVSRGEGGGGGGGNGWYHLDCYIKYIENILWNVGKRSI